MTDLSLSYLRTHCGPSELPYSVNPAVRFTSITNDSRTVEPGALFVAIESDRDGHNFIADAYRKGARGVLARRQIPLDDWLPFDHREQFAYIVVPDPTVGLQEVARAHRAEHEVGVIGIVGSVGKTSTKEAIAQVLRLQYSVLASPGNFNNEIGLPIALLDLTWEHDRAILEMGAYKIGEIARLCEIADPQMAIVTNLGPTHLESFGSMAAIEQAKGEIFDALPETGLAILNGDDDRVRRMLLRANCPVVLYGLSELNTVRAVDLQTHGLRGISFDLIHPGGLTPIVSPLIGRHSVYACLAAAAVALADDFEPRVLVDAFAAQPTRLRLAPRPGRNNSIVLDDAYNAAPISMIAALDVLAEHSGRRVAILGDMLELGEVEMEGHQMVGAHVPGRVDLLITIGRRARIIGEAAEAAGMRSVIHVGATSDLEFEPAEGDLILVKASRGMQLEKVVARLVEGNS